ncbi:histidine phosphatase superfamily [Phycomyces blakesleeanus]|uniref:Phosphoglycerate mutase-like protein n=2 Tax=Phycomyces blakesleeanus TaxID=4837 RepID=A0A162PL96_PHYB8|nr:hypothetical protein PHYBLDRAFT_182693 [Phycomyces blakesleeanus NRRL 1555(-)]OAD69966.1 hypothetical protein PHYBLDRAFT_182693 [Phycomyces blakesleeanus NRRL 1555(-)]|eukprot:XP_018288006.1 hypothetical protein PHYBLDRAFT_182693 [Phycomyces blakesleeanus NRRL 1555(-)]
MTLRITLVRHGNTDANVEKWLQGHTDTTLNTCGLSQADRVGERLSTEKIDKVYCSSLTRCHQTAAAITAHHPGLQTVYLDGLRERGFGKLEGQSIRAAFRGYNRSLQSSDNHVKAAGGETEAEFRQRICTTFQEITEEARAAKETNILVVTHGGPLRTLTHWWVNELGYISKDDTVVPAGNHGNTGVTCVVLHDNKDLGNVIEIHNSMSHIQEDTGPAPESV